MAVCLISQQRTRYDRLDRLVKTTFPNGTTNQRVLDSAGRRTSFTDALGNETNYAFDAVGQLTSTTYEDGLKDEFTYDAQGRRTKVVDRAGRATRLHLRLDWTRHQDSLCRWDVYNPRL